MRHVKPGGWLAGLGKAAFALAFSVAGAQALAAGITDTKHNLSTSNTRTGENRVTAGTAEICVFCHTPHAANTGVSAPLWNKTNPSTTYTTYSTTNSSTIDGSVLSVGSVSLACLSCHDGSQAMDNIINAPGSGGYDTTGGGAAGRGYTWDTTTTRVDADGKMLGFAAVGASGDLVNDHPIGIQYCGGGPKVGATGTACVDADFKAPSNAAIGSTTVFWVNTSVTGSTTGREKTDMILYNRDFAAGTGPSVECASCHDPHVNSADSGSQAGATFLRISNAGSSVCLACHTK